MLVEQWELFDCIGDYRISGRTQWFADLDLDLDVFGFVWFRGIKFIDRRSRVGVLEFLESSMMRISLSHKKLISKQSLVYKRHRSR
jgi:hypothetical protein